MVDNDSLSYQADSDLAARTRWSTLSYLALFIVTISLSSYLIEHPYTIYTFGSLLLIGTIGRIYLSLKFELIYQKSNKAWRIAFYFNMIFLAASWGIFVMLSVLYYELQWISMVVILATNGLAAGAVSTIYIRYYQIVTQLSLMLLPTAIITLHLGTKQAYGIAALAILFFFFMLLVAKRHNNEYWLALKNANLLKQRARELENSNKELESYSYSIAHDLRAPLRTIVSYSQILMIETESKLSDDEKDHLKRVEAASKNMAGLIDDILELSRITRGKIKTEPVDLSKVANQCADLLGNQKKDRSVEWNIEPDLITKGDPQLLYLAMQNLLGNSWKFTSKKGNDAKIQVGAKRNNKKITYYVKDNGIGFDMKFSKKVFRPFERLQTEYEGSGVGLATVARIVERHGGEVWCESKSDEGTTIYFTL